MTDTRLWHLNGGPRDDTFVAMPVNRGVLVLKRCVTLVEPLSEILHRAESEPVPLPIQAPIRTVTGAYRLRTVEAGELVDLVPHDMQSVEADWAGWLSDPTEG